MSDDPIRDQPTSGRLEGGVHLLPVRVYYEDTDFTGIVYHANYLRFMERGRTEFLRVMGTPPDRTDHGIFAVTRVAVDYRSPARIHDALIIKTTFTGMRGPRLNFEQSIDRAGTVLAEAEIVAVAIHADGRARKPSPAELTHWETYKRPSRNGP